MAPVKRRQGALPRGRKTKRANVSESPQTPLLDSPHTPLQENAQQPEDPTRVRRKKSTRHASPPPELSTKVNTRPKSYFYSGMDTASPIVKTGSNSTDSSPFLDWLQVHADSFDEKRSRSDPRPQSGSDSKKGPTEKELGLRRSARQIIIHKSTRSENLVAFGDPSSISPAGSPSKAGEEEYMMSGALPAGAEPGTRMDNEEAIGS